MASRIRRGTEDDEVDCCPKAIQWTNIPSPSPFWNLSLEPDTEFFTNGFVENLTADLTRFPALRVLVTQSTFGLSQFDRFVTAAVFSEADSSPKLTDNRP